MKFYLASSFKNYLELNIIEKELKTLGHEVIDVWWNIDTKSHGPQDNDELWYNWSIVKSILIRHFKAIDNCDALILVSSDQFCKFTGANIEVGYALGKNIPVFSIGKLEKSAM